MDTELELSETQVLRIVNPTPQRYPREEAAYGAQLTETDRLAYAALNS